MLGFVETVDFVNKQQRALAVLAADFGSPAAIGELLFTQYLLPFEITSVLLLVAMIGVVVLTRRRLKPKS